MTPEERKEKKRLYMIEYRKNNPNKGKEYMIEYSKKNPNKTKEWRKNNPDKVKQQQKAYKKNSPDKIKKIKLKEEKNRKKNNPIFKMSCNIRSSIYNSLKNNSIKKSIRTEEILGCSFEQFKLYIELQFLPWMNWNNHGKYKKDVFNYGWDLDHIVPVSSAKTKEELLKRYHYTNYQPLCVQINRFIKRDN